MTKVLLALFPAATAPSPPSPSSSSSLWSLQPPSLCQRRSFWQRSAALKVAGALWRRRTGRFGGRGWGGKLSCSAGEERGCSRKGGPSLLSHGFTARGRGKEQSGCRRACMCASKGTRTNRVQSRAPLSFAADRMGTCQQAQRRSPPSGRKWNSTKQIRSFQGDDMYFIIFLLLFIALDITTRRG